MLGIWVEDDYWESIFSCRVELTSCIQSGVYLDVGELPGSSTVVSVPIDHPSKADSSVAADVRHS